MKSFLTLLICFSVMLGMAKEAQVSLPVLPPSYSSKLALTEFGTAADSLTSARLRSWFFHHSFGGERPKDSAFEQPRLAQALWLALTTQALVLGQMPLGEAEAHLEHLCRQKAVPSSTLEFFTALWRQKIVSMDQAADYLRGWMEPQNLKLNQAEQKAVRDALASGCRVLAFLEKNLSPVQSTPKR